MRPSIVLLCLLGLVAVQADDAADADAGADAEPVCITATEDQKSETPHCDPCSAQVYKEYDDPRSIEMYQKISTTHCDRTLHGWHRFTLGTGKLSEKCTMMNTCGTSYTNWLNGEHPSQDEGIVERELCSHRTQGTCCTDRKMTKVKNCGTFFVYYLPNPFGNCNTAYCVVPKPEDNPDICNDPEFIKKTDSRVRGELAVTHSTATEITTGNDNEWYTFEAGNGKIKQTCPGYYHCNTRYPSWIKGEYPTEDGQVTHVMSQTAANEFCQVTHENPMYIVKCGDKYYHKAVRSSASYAQWCISEDIKDVCDRAETLSEDWRGTQQSLERQQCDTYGLDFEDWYRFSGYNKRMPTECVPENKCGTDKAYWMIGEHPKPHEGVVGRSMSYASKTNCRANTIQGYVLNCGDDNEDDFVYHFTKPGGCDMGFCVEEDPCTAYTELSEPERGARSEHTKVNLDVDLPHGWYRFMNDKGVMPQSPIIAGHSGIAHYPGWYNGEMPKSEKESKQGKTCFVVNANTCAKELPTTVRNCGNYYVYHLQNPASTYGYTVEQEVCTLPTMKLDEEYRKMWTQDETHDDNGIPTGWYQFTVGTGMMPTSPGIWKHGGVRNPGWMEGEHPTEEEGIVERTVNFITSDVAIRGNYKKTWVRNCGGYFMYYLVSPGSSYGYTVAQDICSAEVAPQVMQINDPTRLYTNLEESTSRHDKDIFKGKGGIYRFMGGKGKLVESPRIQGKFHGGFLRNYYFPAGSHASVGVGEYSQRIELVMGYSGSVGGGISMDWNGWPWYMQIANCGGHYLYVIHPLSSSYTSSGIVVDADEKSLCKNTAYWTENNPKRLVTTIGAETGTDHTMASGWYRFTAGLGRMPVQKFSGTQCGSQYHGVLTKPHPSEDQGIVEDNVCWTSTSTSCQSNTRVWVVNCGGFYVYRLKASPGSNYRYCESASGCKNPRVINDPWRINGQKVTTGKHEKSYFGDDGWVKFDIGLNKLPEKVSPVNMGGCTHSGYIDSHPKISDGVVDRVLRFSDDKYTKHIQVQNCGNDVGYVYFLTGSDMTNNYCFVADSDVCQSDVHTEQDDPARLRYAYTGTGAYNSDNYFEGWYRFMGGKGQLMNEPPTLDKMCSANYQGWVDGENPKPGEGVVTRKLCWRESAEKPCFESNDINIKSCSNAKGEQYLVYGIVQKPKNANYGHCVDQDRQDVCQNAEKLTDPARGMLTPSTKLLNDDQFFDEFKHYRFMNGLGRIVNFPVKGSYCGSNNYKVLMKQVLQKDENTGDFRWQAGYYTSSWNGVYQEFSAVQCDGYVVYGLYKWNRYKSGYCIEEDICTSNQLNVLNNKANLQYTGVNSGSTFHQSQPGWYKVTIGNKKLATSPSDVNDCGSSYPGHIRDPEPTQDDGIKENFICWRTSDTSVPASCKSIYQRLCPSGMIYYLDSVQTSGAYSMCIETDVCDAVKDTVRDLDDSWRMSGNPSVGSGDDNFTPGGWWKVNIGKGRLAENRAEATCGATYGGWLELGRHPTKAEGIVNTRICYDPNHKSGEELVPRNCYPAQVVNCGNNYMYKITKTGGNYGVCIATDQWPMCTDYMTLDEDWRVVDKPSPSTKMNDKDKPDGWYRFEVGTGKLATTRPIGNYFGGGTYPTYCKDADNTSPFVMPAKEDGVKEFKIGVYWGSGTPWYYVRSAWVKQCDGFPVYYLRPNQGPASSTYTVESNYCEADTYTVLDDPQRLSWSPVQGDQLDDKKLEHGWYRFKGGINNQINEQCSAMMHGGFNYPGWMEGGHPEEDNVVVERKVWFRKSTNCKANSVTINVKKCGGFFVYRLSPVPEAQMGYTISSDPCKVDVNEMSDEDRSIYNKDQTNSHDNSLPEGWYKITTGNKVLPKKSPSKNSCKTLRPSWMNGADPTTEEGVVTREYCTYRHESGEPSNPDAACYWKKDIKVRNCGNYMLYYFMSLPVSGARVCVEHTLKQTCESAQLLDDDWRGSAYQMKKGQTTKDDKDLPHGWYKFGAHSGKLANFPVSLDYCGSKYPLHMEGPHNLVKGTCETKKLHMSHSRTSLYARTDQIEECLCENGEYIYYHTHKAWITGSYQSTFCEEMDPCNNYERIYSSYRSAWNPTTVSSEHNDHEMEPNWVTLQYGDRKMPTFDPEYQSCGRPYPGWYDGEMPVLAGEEKHGQTCFVTSATALCSSPRKTQVRKCANGKLIYHWQPTASANYGYCIDQDVCGVPAEQWGYKDHSSRLRWSSVSGYKTPTNDNSIPKKNWYTMTAGLKRMPEECVGYQSCGAQYPGWLNGKHPTRDEGLVEREVCFRDATDCCKYKQNIKIIQCRDRFMYRLQPTTSSNRRYCIDESPDDVCTMDVPEITDKRHGIGHFEDTSFLSDYQIYTQPSWFKISVHSNTFIHYPPPMSQCGSKYPGWVKDPMPTVQDGVVDTYSCFRQSMSNEDCYQSQPMKMRNCEGEMRYMYVPPGAATRNMCVEEDICAEGNHQVYDDEGWRLAYSAPNNNNADWKTDYRKIEAPYKAWFRWTNTGLNKIVDTQQEMWSCGTQHPAWLDGEHPTEEEGVVTRKLQITNGKNYVSTSTQVLIKNCGGFYLYSVNTDFRSGHWAMCIDTDVCDAPVMQLNQPSRLLNVWGHLKASDDASLPRGWYRFENGYEQMPEECPSDHACGCKEPGWLSQPHPTEEEGLAERKVCFADADQCCQNSADILVKNCGSHYVYRLYEQGSSKKYCVDESANSMCQNYGVIDDPWRGENIPWDSENPHGDGELEHGWYRFTTELGHMPEYCMSWHGCGARYTSYLESGTHPTKEQGIVEDRVCFTTSNTNCGQSCIKIRVRNCGKFWVYELVPSHSMEYGYCVAQEQCDKAIELGERWRLVLNPSPKSAQTDNTMRKGWYRMVEGSGRFADYEPETNYGGAVYPGYVEDALPTKEQGMVDATVKYAGTGSTTAIKVKNCGEHFIYWLQPTPGTQYTMSIDQDICLHAKPLDEEWRSMFNIVEDEERETDYNRGRDWYQFTTGFKQMAEDPPAEPNACGTQFAGYLRERHPRVDEGILTREVCYRDDRQWWSNNCFKKEDVKVKNCGDMYAYQLNPKLDGGAYCAYNRKSNCIPKVIHAKYGSAALINCSLSTDDMFDAEEVHWTKLSDTKLPDSNLDNMVISGDNMMVNIDNMADKNAGVYGMYIPSTDTSEMVEVILYNAVETEKKYYYANVGDDVEMNVVINVEPAPAAGKVSWTKGGKALAGGRFVLSEENRRLTIKGLTKGDTGTYKCTVQFTVDGVDYTKSSTVIVKLEEAEL